MQWSNLRCCLQHLICNWQLVKSGTAGGDPIPSIGYMTWLTCSTPSFFSTKTVQGHEITLESVDWPAHGPWNVHLRLFGLNEFAAEVTSLAMQKPGTNVV